MRGVCDEVRANKTHGYLRTERVACRPRLDEGPCRRLFDYYARGGPEGAVKLEKMVKECAK